jgi:hypothetical protein
MDKDEKKLLEIKIREQAKIIPVFAVIGLLYVGFQIAWLLVFLLDMTLLGIIVSIVAILLVSPLYKWSYDLTLKSVRKKYDKVLKI